MVLGLLRVAAAVGAIPVAKGVETEAQRDFLAEHGCAHGQGFLLAPPEAP